MYKLCNLISIIISSAIAFIALFILEFQAPEHACIPIMLLSFEMQKKDEWDPIQKRMTFLNFIYISIYIYIYTSYFRNLVFCGYANNLIVGTLSL